MAWSFYIFAKYNLAGERMPPGGQTYADNLDFIGGGNIGSEHGFIFGGGDSLGLSDRRQSLDLDPFGDYGGLPQGFDPLGSYNFGSSYRRRRSAQVNIRCRFLTIKNISDRTS